MVLLSGAAPGDGDGDRDLHFNFFDKRLLRLTVGRESAACWDACPLEGCFGCALEELDCPPTRPPGGSLGRSSCGAGLKARGRNFEPFDIF